MIEQLILTTAYYRIPLDCRSAKQAKDGLAKSLYGQLFRRIVQHLNLIAESPSAKSGTDLDIGILDVAGFGTYNRI